MGVPLPGGEEIPGIKYLRGEDVSGGAAHWEYSASDGITKLTDEELIKVLISTGVVK